MNELNILCCYVLCLHDIIKSALVINVWKCRNCCVVTFFHICTLFHRQRHVVNYIKKRHTGQCMIHSIRKRKALVILYSIAYCMTVEPQAWLHFSQVLRVVQYWATNTVFTLKFVRDVMSLTAHLFTEDYHCSSHHINPPPASTKVTNISGVMLVSC